MAPIAGQGIDNAAYPPQLRRVTVERLKEQLDRVPFVPFTLHLVRRQKIRVVHPDFVALTPRGRVAIVVTEDDRTYYVDLQLVEEIEAQTPAA